MRLVNIDDKVRSVQCALYLLLYFSRSCLSIVCSLQISLLSRNCRYIPAHCTHIVVDCEVQYCLCYIVVVVCCCSLRGFWTSSIMSVEVRNFISTL